MLDLFELLRKEGGVIKAAPMSVVALMAVAVVATGAVANFFSSREIREAKDQRQDALDERQFYQDCLRTGVLTPTCVKGIKELAPQKASTTAEPPGEKPASQPDGASEAPKSTPKTQAKARLPEKPRPSAPSGIKRETTPVAPAPTYGVLHLDQSKFRLALKKATSGTKCTGYSLYAWSSCYEYRIYIGGAAISSTDNVDINTRFPATYEFRIVVSPISSTNDILPTFEKSCKGQFEVNAAVGFMEFVAHFEPLDPKTMLYRISDCALVAL